MKRRGAPGGASLQNLMAVGQRTVTTYPFPIYAAFFSDTREPLIVRSSLPVGGFDE